MAHSKTSATRIQAAERRTQAMALRVEGRTFAEIGKALGCSEQRAHAIVTEELARLNARRAEQAGELTRLECERLDKLTAVLWPAATAGNVDAIDRLLKIMARRARLLGLDAPTQTRLAGLPVVNLTAEMKVTDHAILQDPEAVELLCRVFERIAACPADARRVGLVCQPEEVEPRPALEPPQPPAD